MTQPAECPECWTAVPLGKSICPRCGHVFAVTAPPVLHVSLAGEETEAAPAATMECPFCRAILQDHAERCSRCGQAIFAAHSIDDDPWGDA